MQANKSPKNKTFVKRFLEWIGVKEKLDSRNNKPPFVKEGEIWWVHIGENVGAEISGKGKKFTRPALIYKKLCAHSFLVIPLTTKNKQGTWFVSFMHAGTQEIAVLSQVRIISVHRLDDKIGHIDDRDFERIKDGFKKLYM